MRKIPYFDGHCDSLYYCRTQGTDLLHSDGQVNLARLDVFSSCAQVFAFYSDPDEMRGKSMLPIAKDYHRLFREQLSLCEDRLIHCRSGQDVSAYAGEDRCCALLSLEGAELLDCEPENLEYAQQWGVKLINITWNCENRLSGSHIRSPHRGLSDTGRAFVREANRIGILMDVSHLSEKGFWDLEKITQLPLVASHSNSRRMFDHSRNLTDDQFRAIRDTGGVVGLSYAALFMGEQPNMDDFVRHLEHFLDMDGETCVAFGSDFDGYDTMVGGVDRLDRVPLVYAALEKRGYGQALLDRIFWENWMKLL